MTPITSREYKLILNSDRFADRAAGSASLQQLVAFLAEKLGGSIKRQKKEDRRTTTYLDTSDFRLREAGFAFRLRHEQDGKTVKLTLKHRSEDLAQAATAPVDAASGLKAELKFEEDILPPYRTIFSRSCAIRSRTAPDLADVDRAVRLYPGLAGMGVPGQEKLVPVNGFTATEIFRNLCKIGYPKAPPIKLGLSFWYGGKAGGWPLIAECAFDFDWSPKKKRFDPKQIRNADNLFRLLQQQPGWFDSEATTKTRYAYEGML